LIEVVEVEKEASEGWPRADHVEGSGLGKFGDFSMLAEVAVSGALHLLCAYRD
jgi:hypothetical protein